VRYADVHRERGDLDQALGCLDRALAAYRAAADRWFEADALDRRGQVLLEIGRDEDAEKAFSEAVTLFEEVDDPQRVAELGQRLREVPATGDR
jgi:tetratricopeptide (TPR) repeat protein